MIDRLLMGVEPREQGAEELTMVLKMSPLPS